MTKDNVKNYVVESPLEARVNDDSAENNGNNLSRTCLSEYREDIDELVSLSKNGELTTIKDHLVSSGINTTTMGLEVGIYCLVYDLYGMTKK